jgi:iduronate 2-sulfatase
VPVIYIMLRYLFLLCTVFFAVCISTAQSTVGAYWSFQENQNVGVNDVFSDLVSVNTWPVGIPQFSYSGTNGRDTANYGNSFTAHNGNQWVPGRAITWLVGMGPSTGNSFQITVDTTNIENINVRLKYRLNGVESSAGSVTAFSAFEYSLDGSNFSDFSTVNIDLLNNTSYNNIWSADLSSITSIEDSSSVTLRWSFPDLIQLQSKQIRVDDLEITGVFNPTVYTTSSVEILEMRKELGKYTPTTYTSSDISYALSGTDADAFTINSNGSLSFNTDPVFANKSSYLVVVEMADSQNLSNVEHHSVSVQILESAAITSRQRHHPIGQYNVLFMPIDDLRPLLNVYGEDDPLKPLKINGESGTPNFDRLAASGVTFLNAHCQQAICTASRASFLTGLRPDTTRNWHLETRFRQVMPNVTTLPEHFKNNGYKTYGVGKIFHGQTSVKQDETRSWSEGWDNPSEGRYNFYERGDNTNIWNTWNKVAGTNSSSTSATDVGEFKRDGVTPIEDSDYKDGRAVELAIEKIAEFASESEPFFIGLGFQKPHLPFNAPKKYWDYYDPASFDMSNYLGIRNMPEGTNSFTAPYGGEPSSYGDGEEYLPTITEPASNIFFNPSMPNEASARHLIHGYMACVSFIDAQLGKVLDALEDPNNDGSNLDSIVDNTVVILFGDHGFHLGDHGAFWAKHCNYEISTRVPFIIRSPGMSSLGSAGKMTNAPTELVDAFPTLLDLCSLPLPDKTNSIADDITLYQILEGTSLVPLLEDPEQPWKSAAFSQYQRNITYKPGYDDYPIIASQRGKGMGYSIRTDRYRYTEWWRTRGNYGNFNESNPNKPPYDPLASVVEASQASLIELYDYKTDPHETVNLASPSRQAENADLIAELSNLLHDSDSTMYVGDGWKKNRTSSPFTVPESYPTTESDWKERHRTPGNSNTDLEANADPDNDGIVNRLEYAFGTHPFEHNAVNPIQIEYASHSLIIRYPEVSSRTDISLIPVTSSSVDAQLTTWSPMNTSVARTQGGTEIKEATIPTIGSAGFIRLKAGE